MERKKVKLSLFADDTIFYIENPKDSTKKLIELINEFPRIAGYNIYIQKSVAFYMTITNDQIVKLRKQSHSQLLQKRIKYLGINLTKDAKHLHTEYYKTLKKEVEEDTNKWKHIQCSWIGRINLI